MRYLIYLFRKPLYIMEESKSIALPLSKMNVTSSNFAFNLMVSYFQALAQQNTFGQDDALKINECIAQFTTSQNNICINTAEFSETVRRQVASAKLVPHVAETQTESSVCEDPVDESVDNTMESPATKRELSTYSSDGSASDESSPISSQPAKKQTRFN